MYTVHKRTLTVCCARSIAVHSSSCALSALFIGLCFRVGDVLADMILNQFHRKTIYGPSNRGNEIEYLTARGLVFQSPLDGFELPFKSADARQQLFII